MTDPAIDLNQSGSDLYKRKMRRWATVFIVVGLIVVAASGFLAFSGMNAEYSPDMLFERGVAAGIILITGLMAWNGSRIGAIILFLFVLSGFFDLVSGFDAAALGGLIRTVVFSYIAGLLVWNTYRYHQECQIEGRLIDGSSIVRWGGLAISVPTVGAVLVGLVMMLNPLSVSILRGSELADKHYAWLSEKSYLLANERVLFLHSDGPFSLEDGGTLLTDKYIGMWWQDEGELKDYWFRLGEVCEVKTLSDGGALEDAVYKIQGAGEDNWFNISLSTQGDVHTDLIRRFGVMNSRSMHPRVKQACEAGEVIDYAALALDNGILPDIIDGADVSESHIKWLKERDYLTDTESILSFYSHGTYHIDEGGSLLTDRYFGGWFINQGVPGFVWAELGEICSFEAQEEDSTDEYATYKITFGADGWYTFNLPASENQAEVFVADLKDLNTQAQTPEHLETCKSQSEPEASPDIVQE